jgi:hypothetical protein
VALALNDLRRPIDAKAAVVALLVSVLWGANPGHQARPGRRPAPAPGLDAVRVGGAVVLIWAWATGRLGGLRIARHEVWPCS